MARYFLEFSMKSRILLLIGALAITPTLDGCAVAGHMAEKVGGILNRIAGDRNSAVSQTVGAVGDLYTKVGQSVSDTNASGTGAPVVSAEAVPPPMIVNVPVTKAATVPVPAKPNPKAAAKKPPTSSIQPVAATPADQPAAKPKKGPVN